MPYCSTALPLVLEERSNADVIPLTNDAVIGTVPDANRTIVRRSLSDFFVSALFVSASLLRLNVVSGLGGQAKSKK